MSTFTYHNIHHHDIDASSSDSDSDLFESSEPDHHRPSLPRAILPVIPDLRFEQSYLKSIKDFIHVEEDSQELRVVDKKGKGKEKVELTQEGLREQQGAQVIRRDMKPIVDSSHHLVGIQWSQVAWVTTRDQVISPLLQGALWGVASYFLRPLMSLVGSQVRGVLPSVSNDQTRGAGWWKWWIHGLGLGPAPSGGARTSVDISTR